ncbi:hypothetical protein PRK78_004137 [Emydomyces testavorans]|uniref:Peptidase M14 domain-containing protein n=1 Tax=Emydomyces testavorans TaxID=2070801 RepID=A0AAF0DI67_9EURO|nr:hypothetical protein PRK78_004137 [Emydomyces testavorans]
MYIDWHSYSQLFMIPYGYDCNRRASNHELQMSLANTFAEALQKVHGTPFETGPICNTIYPVNGGSVDWAFDVNHFELSFTPELRDKGRYGFVLPADQIVPSGEESWAGIKAMMAKL